MMLVDTEVRQSAIHGLGVFLLEPVKAGQVIWRFDARIDRVYGETELASLPDHVQRFLRTYSTWHESTGLYVLCGDNGRFFNHSQAPSTLSRGVSFGED
jgi:SET domain-containing protein